MIDSHDLNWLLSSSEIKHSRTNSIQGAIEYYANGDKPRLLITSGMHGDESGVISSVSHAVRTHMSRLPIFIYIPIINQAGVLKQVRGNTSGLDINRSFRKEGMTEESMGMMELLGPHRFDLCVSFHEDPELPDFYMYDLSSPESTVDISANLKRFKLKLKEWKIDMLNGIDDPSDPHLGNEFIDGYKIFQKKDMTNENGQMEDWLLKNDIAQRVFNPEIPSRIAQAQKDEIIDEFFKDLIIPFF